jgi:hypothetical protein
MVEQVKKEEWTKSFEEGDGPSRGGRQYHGVKDSSYWLPKDEDEQLRLTGVSTLK